MVLAPHVVIPSDSQGPMTPQRRESVVGFANSTVSHSIQLLQFLQPYSAAAAPGKREASHVVQKWADQYDPNKLVLPLSAPLGSPFRGKVREAKLERSNGSRQPDEPQCPWTWVPVGACTGAAWSTRQV